jgi:hypothetical protein
MGSPNIVFKRDKIPAAAPDTARACPAIALR